MLEAWVSLNRPTRPQSTVQASFPPTHDLVQHEALPVDLHADPLDLAVHLRILDFQADHVPLHRPVVERFPDGVVVEVATVCQRGSSIDMRDFLESTMTSSSTILIRKR